MKKLLIAFCALACVLSAGAAAKWKGLDEASHLSGDQLTEDDLLGKVVMLFLFDESDKEAVQRLKDVEKTLTANKAKPFVVLGSHFGSKDKDKVKAVLEKAKATFPVYQKLDLDPSPKQDWVKPPFYCVLDHRGAVEKSGGSDKEAFAALATAFAKLAGTSPFCEGLELKKLKGLSKQIVLGKNVAQVVKKLEKDKEAKDLELAAEAQQILSAIDEAHDNVKDDIEIFKKADPAEAIRLIGLFAKTWPKDESVADLKASIPDLKKAAAEKKAADKAKAKEEAKKK